MIRTLAALGPAPAEGLRPAGGAALLVLVAQAAPAQGFRGPCLPHRDAVETLRQRHGHHQASIAIGVGGSMVVDPGLDPGETGTFTILVTRADGLGCVAVAGESWSTAPLPAGDPS